MLSCRCYWIFRSEMTQQWCLAQHMGALAHKCWLLWQTLISSIRFAVYTFMASVRHLTMVILGWVTKMEPPCMYASFAARPVCWMNALVGVRGPQWITHSMKCLSDYYFQAVIPVIQITSGSLQDLWHMHSSVKFHHTSGLCELEHTGRHRL